MSEQGRHGQFLAGKATTVVAMHIKGVLPLPVLTILQNPDKAVSRGGPA